MSEHKRRRISGVGWLLVVAVVMVGLWVFVAVWLPYQREQAAIREIERVGGSVGLMPAGTIWLSVWSVDLSGTTVSDKMLQHVSGLRNLRASFKTS